MENFITNKYNELKETEQALFQAYPLLKVGKSLTQTLALPALTAGAATHLPLAGPVIGSAVHHGTDFLQNHLHGFNESRITQHFADLRQNIQPGFAYAVRQKAFDSWATIRSADLLAKSDLWTKPLSGYVAPSVVGKAVLDIGTKAATYMAALPVSKQIGQVIAQSQALIGNVQDWIQSSYQNIKTFVHDAQKFTQREINKLSQNPEQSQNGHKVEGQTDHAAPHIELPQPFPVPTETVVAASETQIEPETPKDNQAAPDIEPTLNLEPETTTPDLKPETPAEVLEDSIPEVLTNQAQPDSEAMTYFQQLASELGGRNLNTEKMKIFFDNQEVFRLSDGQPDMNNTMVNNDQMAAFKEALADPTNFKGELEIRQGSKLLLSIKNGQVYDPMNKVQELLSIKMTTGEEQAPAQAQAPDNPLQGLYARYAEGVSSQGVQQVEDIAKNAIEAGVLSQSEITTMLTEHNPTLKAMASQNGPAFAKSQAQDLIQSASDSLLMAKPEVQQQQQQRQEQKQAQSVSQKM